MHFFLIFALALAVLAVIFAMQNTTIVTVSLFVWEFTGSLAVVLLLALGLGVIVSLLATFPKIQGRKWQTNKIRRQLEDTQNEMNQLRNTIAQQKSQIDMLRMQLDLKPTQSPENPMPTDPTKPV